MMKALMQSLKLTEEGRKVLKTLAKAETVLEEYDKPGEKLHMRRAVEDLRAAIDSLRRGESS